MVVVLVEVVGGGGGCDGDWRWWGVRGGEGDDVGLVGVENLVEGMVNFGEERMVMEVGFGEIGGGRRLLVVEGDGGVKRKCWGVGWVA